MAARSTPDLDALVRFDRFPRFWSASSRAVAKSSAQQRFPAFDHRNKRSNTERKQRASGVFNI
jgi:hypothetical protein